MTPLRNCSYTRIKVDEGDYVQLYTKVYLSQVCMLFRNQSYNDEYLSAANDLDRVFRELRNTLLEWNVNVDLIKRFRREETIVHHGREQVTHPGLAVIDVRLLVKLDGLCKYYNLVTLFPGVVAENVECVQLFDMNLDLWCVEVVVAWSTGEVNNLSEKIPFVICPVRPANENMAVVRVCSHQPVCLEHNLLDGIVIRVLISMRVDSKTTSCDSHVWRE